MITAEPLLRREVFKGLLAFAAVTNLAPTAWAAEAAKSFVTPAQTAFLASFTDTLIPATDTPGGAAAQVHLGLIALLDRWAAPANRDSLTAAIDRIAAALDGSVGVPFITASPTARLTALTAFDAQAFGAARPRWQDYRTLKSLAVRLYYTSQIGAEQELRYDPLPGGYSGAIPFTPGDRSWSL